MAAAADIAAVAAAVDLAADTAAEAAATAVAVDTAVVVVVVATREHHHPSGAPALAAQAVAADSEVCVEYVFVCCVALNAAVWQQPRQCK